MLTIAVHLAVLAAQLVGLVMVEREWNRVRELRQHYRAEHESQLSVLRAKRQAAEEPLYVIHGDRHSP